MGDILRELRIEDASVEVLCDDRLTNAYLEYVERRSRFLLGRFDKYPDFPGVQTGYNSITGEEFADDELLSYAWINGRGACVCSRFARHFPEHGPKLKQYARHTIEALEEQIEINHGHPPFVANLDGTEKVIHEPFPPGHKSYSDLYVCLGFLEYGVCAQDPKRVATAKNILNELLAALDEGRFRTEPDPTPPDRILENPWSVALDVTNEFVRQLNDDSYLEAGGRLLQHLLDNYYLPEIGALVEYVTPEGQPFVDPRGRYVVDPGHAIELASFAMQFARLAEQAGVGEELRRRVVEICPPLVLWNIEKGWNESHPGIHKTIDARSGTPIDDTMPWWILPETMLALLLAFEITGNPQFLQRYMQTNNAYFTYYMNPKTSLGPFQNLDGKTGRPVDIPPACKFQDPEFHSGKNILSCIQVLKRLT